MIRRTTRPLNEAERAELEKPIISMPGKLWPHLVGCMVGLVPGGILAYLGVMGFQYLSAFSPWGRVVIGLLSAAVVLAGLFFAGLGLWALYSAFPRKPVVVRPARDLRAASADVLEIIANRGWLIDTGDEDVGSFLLLGLPEGRYLLLDSPEVDDLQKPGADVPIASTTTIVRFDGHCVAADTQGMPIPITEVSPQELTESPWVLDALDVATETELTANQLTPALQRLVATPP